MLTKLQTGYQLWRHFGVNWLGFRLAYALEQRTGLQRRRLPQTSWAQQPLAHFLDKNSSAEPADYLAYRRQQAPAFFFTSADQAAYRAYFASWDAVMPSPIAVADDLGRGLFRYFEHQTIPLGFPPNWHHNALSGESAPANLHWSQLPDFGFGDIKVIWEPSRFGFVFTLVRAYWRTGDERYAELFWQLVEDWQKSNPPQSGANWKCGQETALRVMAWCFGLYGFLSASATTAERVAMLAQMIAVSGQRIAQNLRYALSQRNNHGISEAMGLWTIGLLFPELHSASRWRQTGKQLLEELGHSLVYADGSFVQHSVNYHRLMLHDYLWALRLGDICQQPFSQALKTRIAQAGDWLYQLQDEQSGRVPHYGQTDGALVLPLNNCDYLDFRPAVQAVHYLATGERCYQVGPWDEDLLWLFGPAALRSTYAPQHRGDLVAEIGGYYTMRTATGLLFTRCATFKDRPGQADLLHVDLWWRGQNIAIDAGAFSYNAPAPWDNALSHTCYHNTVTVDAQDQMEQVGKFLWLPWLHSQVRCQRTSAQLAYWEGEHDGYQRLDAPVRHRRGIVRINEATWLILDSLVSTAPHLYRLHWLLADLPYTWHSGERVLTLQSNGDPYYLQCGALEHVGEASLVRADPHSPRGWQARYYHQRAPALSLELSTQTPSIHFWSLFSPTPCTFVGGTDALTIQAPEWRARMTLSNTAESPLAKQLTLQGIVQETLSIF